MARYSYGGRRKRSRGASTYGKVTTENISVLRLYASDGFPELYTPQGIAQALNIRAKKYDFRLIAVGFGTNSSGAAQTLEFADGSTYQLAANSSKPARVRVPQKAFQVGQYFSVNWGTGTSDTYPSITPALTGVAVSNSGFATKPLWNINGNQGNGSCLFIDVAIRF